MAKGSDLSPGMLVVANEGASSNYTTTTEGWEGIVVRVHSDSWMTVQDLTHGRRYDVDPVCFDLKNKFKPGDIVVANTHTEHRYGITKPGWIGEVVENIPKNEDGSNIIVKGTNKAGRIMLFEVDETYFDLLKPNKIEKSNKIIEIW